MVFDFFHHEINNSGEKISDIFKKITKTWNKDDGIPMCDYSTQEPDKNVGKHSESIDLNNFKSFIEKTKPFDFDIMLEIKDKETSALKAIKILRSDSRLKFSI